MVQVLKIMVVTFFFPHVLLSHCLLISSFRSVSEKNKRPLLRMRPASTAEERISFNKTTTKLTR